MPKETRKEVQLGGPDSQFRGTSDCNYIINETPIIDALLGFAEINDTDMDGKLRTAARTPSNTEISYTDISQALVSFYIVRLYNTEKGTNYRLSDIVKYFYYNAITSATQLTQGTGPLKTTTPTGYVTKDEHDTLRKQVEELEVKLAQLELTDKSTD